MTDQFSKKIIINHNNYLFTYDFLSKVPIYKSSKIRYNENFYLPQLLI